MTPRMPNLWKMKLEADDYEPGTLYRLYICQLMLNEEYDRIIEACRIIRRYAFSGPGVIEGLFTFDFEMNCLLLQGRLDIALRQARLRDQAYYGHSDYSNLVWKEDTGQWPIYTVAPLHYFHKMYELGRHILESGLEPFFKNDWQSSYYWFTQIAPLHKNPKSIYQVTLAMFYHKLGRDLREWKHWNAFIDGFPNKFFTVIQIGKESLRANPKLLQKVVARIRTIHRINKPYYTSGPGQVIEDIIESPIQIRKRHDQRLKEAQESKESKRERAQHRRQCDRRLKELFPELRA